MSSSTSDPNPQCVRYRRIVTWGLSAEAIRFATAGALGHRVEVMMPVDLMNQYFRWQRQTGSAGPSGEFVAAPTATSGPAPVTFRDCLRQALGTPLLDVDGVANGLNFSSNALNKTGDPLRDQVIYNVQTDTAAPKKTGEELETGLDADFLPTTAGVSSSTHYSANDLVMSWVLYKCFGASSYDPTEAIYNIQDAFAMLSSDSLAQAINDSLAADQPSVNDMFLKFLDGDKNRFKVNGVLIPGLFETNYIVDAQNATSGAGNWCLTQGDKLEIPLRLVFTAPVTVNDGDTVTQHIAGEAGGASLVGAAAAANANLNANIIPLRLRLVCGAPLSGTATAATTTAAPSSAVLPLEVGASVPVSFYVNGGVQSAIPVLFSGVDASVTYTIAATAAAGAITTTMASANFDCLSISAAGVLIYTPPTGTAAAAVIESQLLDVIATDGAATPNTATATIRVTFARAE